VIRVLKCVFGIVCLALALHPIELVLFARSLRTSDTENFTEHLLGTPLGTFDPATVCMLYGAIAVSLVLSGLALIVSAAIRARSA
jgi:hypothetical protein